MSPIETNRSSTGSKFAIPDRFWGELKHADLTDSRSDDEILQYLATYRPVTSEKNIWAFWHSGILGMPAWCQRNVIDWIRICGPEWTVRVLDNTPESANYALAYVSEDLLPEAFVQRKMDGPYVGPHSADFMRGACLIQHGGAFMDVGCILVRSLDDFVWDQLVAEGSPFGVAVPLMHGVVIANHFVVARKQNPFIKRWHELFCHVWQGHTNQDGLMDNPLVAFGLQYRFADSEAAKLDWDFKIPVKTAVEYVTQVVSWSRICMLEEAGDGFSGIDYWQNNVLVFDSRKEDWPAETVLGFARTGQRLLDILSLPLDSDRETELYKQAEEVVWRILTKGSMQKVSHGKGLTHSKQLGTLWDEPENEGKDCGSGTFAELLRYGSLHFRQKRAGVEALQPEKPMITFKKGVLEP